MMMSEDERRKSVMNALDNNDDPAGGRQEQEEAEIRIEPAAVADINRARKIAIWMGSLDRDLMMLTLFLLFINLASI